MAYGLGPVVRLRNRVVNEQGKRVPIEYMVGGEAIWVQDTLDVPIGVARIMIHQSMYKIDPVSGIPTYRLGCKQLGCDESDIPEAETKRMELIERELLADQKREYKRIHNPINPSMSRGPQGVHGSADGAHPGEFGWRE